MAHHVEVEPELWAEFHRVVNMSSRELREWLRTEGAHEETEEFADQAGPRLGHRVLEILGKRRGDLTDRDVHAMRKVVDRVEAERRDDLEPTAGQGKWRHKLMSLGHDPLKGPGDGGTTRQ
jgi:hypothetical protein